MESPGPFGGWVMGRSTRGAPGLDRGPSNSKHKTGCVLVNRRSPGRRRDYVSPPQWIERVCCLVVLGDGTGVLEGQSSQPRGEPLG